MPIQVGCRGILEIRLLSTRLVFKAGGECSLRINSSTRLGNGRDVQVARDPDTLLLIVTCLIRIAALVRQSEVPKRHVFHAVVKSIDKILFCRMKQSANTAFTLNFSNGAVQNGIMIRHHHFMNICINFTPCCIFFCRNKEYHYAE